MYNLIKTPSLFFTGRKLRPPGIGIEATLPVHDTCFGSSTFFQNMTKYIT